MTQTTITAILIDPFVLTMGEWSKPVLSGIDAVREIQITRNGNADADLGAIYAALSHEKHPVDMIEAIRLPAGDVIYVDEEGLFKEHDHWWRLHGFPNPIRGRGIVFGTDRHGNSVAPKIKVDQVRRNVEIGTDFFYTCADMPNRNRDGSPSKRQAFTSLLRPAIREFAARPWGKEGTLR